MVTRMQGIVEQSSDALLYQFTLENQVLDYIKTAMRNMLLADEERLGLPQKVSSVQFVTASLQRHLERLLNFEDEVGLVEPADVEKPHLAEKAHFLQRDHLRIRRELHDLAQAAHELSPSEEHYFHAYCRNALVFLDALDQHERAEMNLLQQLHNSDVGGEG